MIWQGIRNFEYFIINCVVSILLTFLIISDIYKMLNHLNYAALRIFYYCKIKLYKYGYFPSALMVDTISFQYALW